MTTLSSLALAPYHRRGGGGATERWTWDFVVDGRPLSAQLGGGDVVGTLGWGKPAWEAAALDKLLARAAPDLPPDRVALYVCPECGDLGCGAVTASVVRENDTVVWRDFAWERDWDDAPDHGQWFDLGPFWFERGEYGRVLRAAAASRPGPGTPLLDAL